VNGVQSVCYLKQLMDFNGSLFGNGGRGVEFSPTVVVGVRVPTHTAASNLAF
jgi:hypothetical protein